MSGILSGMQITESAAFIAAPFATMSLGRLGAEVIRIDPLQGGIDYRRWPVAENGQSLYWAALNKGKKSVAIDLKSAEGRELAQAIITAPGEERGLFVTNFQATGWLDFEALRGMRSDLIMINIVGNHDDTTALDYTVNCAVGFPGVTGPEDETRPANHVLPAWDFICGQTASTALLACERHRRLNGEGQRVRIALSDVAIAVVGDMGIIAEVDVNGVDRARCGNHIYGAFGRDFVTADSRRVMVAAVSVGQWKALCKATEIEPHVAVLEQREKRDMTRDDDRFLAREAIAALLESWIGARSLAEIRALFDANRVCWGPYQSFEQLVREDLRCSTNNPMLEVVEHPLIGPTLTPRSPMEFSGCENLPPPAGPLLGQHTEQVLCEVLGLDSSTLGVLQDKRVIDLKASGAD